MKENPPASALTNFAEIIGIAAVRQWLWKPATLHGHPVAVWKAVPVKFSIH